jgi:hypothetical protein
MSFGFSLGSSADEARRPLLENGSGTPDPPRRSFMSSLFGSDSDSRPVSPVPVDTRGFETFPVTFADGIQLNVLENHPAEAAIVREILEKKTNDPSKMCEFLRISGVSGHFFPDKHEKEIKKLVCKVLDEINFYREGCSQVQIKNMLDELEQKEHSVAQDVAKAKSMSLLAQASQQLKFESKIEKLERETIEAANDKRDNKIKLLKRRIPYCQKRRQELMADSLVSKFDANDARECAFVKWCRLHNPSLNGRAMDEFCGKATVLNDDGVATEILEVDPTHDVKFEVLISGDGTQSLATSVRITALCPVSPGSRIHVMSAQAFTPDKARKIEDDVKNALFNDFKEPETANVPNVPTNATIHLFGLKACDPVGHVVVTEEADLNTCCFPKGSCSVWGGAKKIKRAQQSKKKKARRSKSKSKRVRRKNKSRRI